MQKSLIWIAIGANIPGAWGAPQDTFAKALDEIEHFGLRPAARSGLYITQPLGRTGQPNFLNAVFGISGSISPAALLRLLKHLEVKAGRRPNERWGPRPLDLDILDFGGRVIGNCAAKRVRGRLVLPHPELTRRGFVLVPLAEIAPRWHHPGLDVSAATLLKRTPGLASGIRRLGTWDRR